MIQVPFVLLEVCLSLFAREARIQISHYIVPPLFNDICKFIKYEQFRSSSVPLFASLSFVHGDYDSALVNHSQSKGFTFRYLKGYSHLENHHIGTVCMLIWEHHIINPFGSKTFNNLTI
jgi:hypothetical protein